MTPPPDLLGSGQCLLEWIDTLVRDGGTLEHLAQSHRLASFRRAIAHEEGLRRNAQIRTKPLLQTIQARDAAGTLRLGYRPEPEQEDEGED